MELQNSDNNIKGTTYYIILFYSYQPLQDVSQLQKSLQELCQQLQIQQGRILLSSEEGWNGTLASDNLDALQLFCQALGSDGSGMIHPHVKTFRQVNPQERFAMTAEDFKWSTTTASKSTNNDDGNNNTLFPDLVIKIVPELIGTGGVLRQIPITETSQGYLEPEEFHQALIEATDKDTIVIDCRNTKEYQIGHFQKAIDPQTTTFGQFPKWVQDHEHLLHDKNVLMYCTGGIRCEKASAFIRRTIPTVKTVRHLKGGIHKYLERHGDGEESMWQGRNFVFDGRQAATAEETRLGKDGVFATVASTPDEKKSSQIVGKCIECTRPYDDFAADHVCTVCREPTLVCPTCTGKLIELHCMQHQHLKTCYFTDLRRFSLEELQTHVLGLEQALQDVAVGRRFRQRRKTLLKQLEKVTTYLQGDTSLHDNNDVASATLCRNCGESDCSGKCWGFFGNKRHTESLAQKRQLDPALAASVLQTYKKQQARSLQKKVTLNEELQQLGIYADSKAFCQDDSLVSDLQSRLWDLRVRVPPVVTRVLKCSTKAKWCGSSVVDVVRTEFKGLEDPGTLRDCLDHGLMLLNDTPLTRYNVAETHLRGSDTLSRLVHWHEPPVLVPRSIGVQVVTLPKGTVESYRLLDDRIWVCNKPATVPAHPAGPYAANSLTVMIEAQESLRTGSLRPIHRIDRVTSGILLCCNDSSVAAHMQRSMVDGRVRKLYVAKVEGRFPSSIHEMGKIHSQDVSITIISDKALEINAPIATIDPQEGIRAVSSEGKVARTRVRLLAYDKNRNESLLACSPITGRSHQIRVHLKSIGLPIVGDVQYGASKSSEWNHVAAIPRQMETYNQNFNHPSIVATSLDESARAACPICRQEDPMACFSPAQRLREGHMICLHALRYEISFPTTSVSSQEDSDRLLVSVTLPVWAEELKNGPPLDWV